MKIIFISLSSASDVHSWSGLTYHMTKALENQGVEIIYIDGLGDKYKGLPYIFQGVKKILYGKLGKHIDIKLSPWRLKQIAKEVEKQLPADADLVFSDSSIPLAYLKTRLPKAFYTDATFGGILGFYRPVKAMAKETIRIGNKLDALALSNVDLAIYSSEWAAESAVNLYKASKGKVKVVSFGANMECDRDLESIKEITRKRLEDRTCNFLFLGVDWQRKGGDFAIEVVEKMNELGIPSVLHVAGVKDIASDKKFVVNHGFLSKGNAEGRAKLDQLMNSAHFLLLPSKADCTPVVYSEANSFGLPVLTSDVGGIKTIIREGYNGKAFPLNTPALQYTEFARSVFIDKEKYKSLSESSFMEYSTRLNWNAAGKALVQLFKNIK